MKKVFESGFAREVPEEEEIKTAGNEPETDEEEIDLKNLTPEQLDQMIISDVDLKVGDTILNPPGYLDRMKELRDMDFSEAGNWTELYAMLVSKGGVATSGGKNLAAKEIIDIIEDVRNGKKLLSAVTRTGGLRDKVMELWLESGQEGTEE